MYRFLLCDDVILILLNKTDQTPVLWALSACWHVASGIALGVAGHIDVAQPNAHNVTWQPPTAC